MLFGVIFCPQLIRFNHKMWQFLVFEENTHKFFVEIVTVRLVYSPLLSLSLTKNRMRSLQARSQKVLKLYLAIDSSIVEIFDKSLCSNGLGLCSLESDRRGIACNEKLYCIILLIHRYFEYPVPVSNIPKYERCYSSFNRLDREAQTLGTRSSWILLSNPSRSVFSSLGCENWEQHILNP